MDHHDLRVFFQFHSSEVLYGEYYDAIDETVH